MIFTDYSASASVSSFWIAGSVFYLLNCNTMDCIAKDQEVECEHIAYLTNWMIVTQIYGHVAYVFVFLQHHDLGACICLGVYLFVLCSETLLDIDALKIPTFYNTCNGNTFWWLLWWLTGAMLALLITTISPLQLRQMAFAVFLVALNMSVVVYFSFWAMIHVDGNIIMRYIEGGCASSQVLVGNEVMHVLPIIINLMTVAVIESVVSSEVEEGNNLKQSEDFDPHKSTEWGFKLTLVVLAVYNFAQLMLRCNESQCSMTRIYTSKMDEYVYFSVKYGNACGIYSGIGALSLFLLQAIMVYCVRCFLIKIFK